MDFNDPKTWDLFKQGRTKGVFQLESNLGRSWSKKLEPSNIEELAALISIIRPGVLRSSIDGKSLSQHYVDRKLGNDEVKYFHPALEDILKTTYGVLVYQEESLFIARKIAGFSLQKADELRKAIGKKKADLMAKLRVEFIDGAIKVGIVTKEEAEQIFDWVEESSRYQFNKCLSPNTLVVTPDGEKELRHVKVGDKVLAPRRDENYYVDVLDVIDNGKKQLYLAKMDTGHSITCTMDHQFLCEDWKKRSLRDILHGSCVVKTDFGQAKFISYEPIGLHQTMDIEVDSEDHVFYGNGIATSNSHAVAYAVNAYMSAWYKANHTKEFFVSYLHHAGDKQDPHQEIYELVSEAKLFDIEVKIPNIGHFTEKFTWDNESIYFGVKDVKSLTGVNGDKLIGQIKDISERIDKPPKEFSWMDVLIYLAPNINSTVFKTLASIGFFSTETTGVSRNKALFEYAVIKQLSKGELDWAIKNYPLKKWATLRECLTDLAPPKKKGGGTSKPEREALIMDECGLLDNPPYDLTDESSWVIDQETKFLGCPITLAKVDAVDTSPSNVTCRDILNGRVGENMCLVANITRYSPYKMKGKNVGKTMAFLTLEDDTCSIDAVIFSEAREKYELLLYEGANLLFCGPVKKDGFIIDKIHEI